MPPSNQPRQRVRLEQHQQQLHLVIPDNGNVAQIPATGNINIPLPFGCRGLDVVVNEGTWVDADLLLYAMPNQNVIVPMRTAAGALAVITGIVTTAAGYYAGPPEWWGLGSCWGFQLHAVDSSGVAVPQTGGPIDLLVIFKS